MGIRGEGPTVARRKPGERASGPQKGSLKSSETFERAGAPSRAWGAGDRRQIPTPQGPHIRSTRTVTTVGARAPGTREAPPREQEREPGGRRELELRHVAQVRPCVMLTNRLVDGRDADDQGQQEVADHFEAG